MQQQHRYAQHGNATFLEYSNAVPGEVAVVGAKSAVGRGAPGVSQSHPQGPLMKAHSLAGHGHGFDVYPNASGTQAQVGFEYLTSAPALQYSQSVGFSNSGQFSHAEGPTPSHVQNGSVQPLGSVQPQMQWNNVQTHAQQEQDDEKFFLSLPEISYTGEQALMAADAPTEEPTHSHNHNQMHARGSQMQIDSSSAAGTGTQHQHHGGLVHARQPLSQSHSRPTSAVQSTGSIIGGLGRTRAKSASGARQF